jgi:hypothetical protein
MQYNKEHRNITYPHIIVGHTIEKKGGGGRKDRTEEGRPKPHKTSKTQTTLFNIPKPHRAENMRQFDILTLTF